MRRTVLQSEEIGGPIYAIVCSEYYGGKVGTWRVLTDHGTPMAFEDVDQAVECVAALPLSRKEVGRRYLLVVELDELSIERTKIGRNL